MKAEVWTNGKTHLILRPQETSNNYYEIKQGGTTLWISGITYYWLISNNYRKL